MLLSPSNVLLFAGGLYILSSLVQYIRDPLRRIPGPALARFTRLWYFYKIYQGDFEKTNIKLHERYGPVVRIAPNQYSIDDVDAAKTIYGHGTNFVKSSWYYAWMSPDHKLATLFADQDPHHHGAQRRKVASAYSMTSLMGYEPFVDNCTALLVSHFREIAQSQQKIDLAHWLQCYAFDVIGEITFGSRFGFLDEGIDKDGVFGAIDSRGMYGTFVGVFSALHSFLFRLLPSTGGHVYVANYTRTQVSSREEQFKQPDFKSEDRAPDFVFKFLTAHAENPAKITPTDIFTTCQSNIAAGSDTTAVTLSSILYHLLKYPSTFKRLQAEIDEGIKVGTVSNPITFKEANALPYLQAVIKEGLRMHSATGLPMLRVVPPAGASIAGLQFPSGAIVGINSWVAHRNTTVYGSDANRWRPERWLEFQDSGRNAEIERYFFAFGMGSRTCIGKNVSLLEISKLIPQLLRQFDFVLDESIHNHDWKSSNRWFVKPTNFFGYPVIRAQAETK